LVPWSVNYSLGKTPFKRQQSLSIAKQHFKVFWNIGQQKETLIELIGNTAIFISIISA